MAGFDTRAISAVILDWKIFRAPVPCWVEICSAMSDTETLLTDMDAASCEAVSGASLAKNKSKETRRLNI